VGNTAIGELNEKKGCRQTLCMGSDFNKRTNVSLMEMDLHGDGEKVR
jgi:hypothetical protein